eukprot:10601463-Alexandrium_andersonii.AAC.1
MGDIGGMASYWQHNDHGRPTCNCKAWVMMDARQCCASGVGARALVQHWRGTGGVLVQDWRNDGKVLARRWRGTGK